MRKKIQVKHTHRYTKSQNILFNGYANCHYYDRHIEYTYDEQDDTNVIMRVYDDHMEIERFGEVHSLLQLYEGTSTLNPMESEYGTFEIEIYTYAYQNDDNYIMVEYDVESGSEDKDGFKIEIEVKEDIHEYN